MAVNISTTRAFVTRHMLIEKQAVKSAMTAKRTVSDLMEYRTTVDAIGSKEERQTPTAAAKRVMPTSEYSTVFAAQSEGFGFCSRLQHGE